MKLVEIQPNKYNDLSLSEPGISFCQTSNWGSFYSRLGFDCVYLGYVDDANVYSALGLFIIKKAESFFAKKTATCPFGYLINYYDTKLLKDFTNDVRKYLSKHGVGQLTINPNLTYITPRGNNDLLIKNMESLGYKKTSNKSIYQTKIKEIEKPKVTEDIYLKTYTVEDRDNKLFKNNANYRYLYQTMGNMAKFVVCEIDTKKSIDALNESINEAKQFIEIHQDDYKYNEKISNKKQAIESKEYLLSLINNLQDECVLAVSCLIEFNNKITQLFVDDKKDYAVINSTEMLQYQVLEMINKLGYESFESYIPFSDSSKTELIGEFTYRI